MSDANETNESPGAVAPHLPPPLSTEEAALRLAIAADPYEQTTRAGFLDYLNERAEDGDEFARMRIDLIENMTATEPFLRRSLQAGGPTETAFVHQGVNQNRIYSVFANHPVQWRGDTVTLEHLLAMENRILGNKLFFSHICHARCRACDGHGRVLVEKELPPRLFGAARLFTTPEYTEETCPRCLGRLCESGLMRSSASASGEPIVNRHAGFSRGFVSDVWFGRNAAMTNNRGGPSDALVNTVMWHPIERLHIWGYDPITEDTTVEEAAQRVGLMWLRPPHARGFLAAVRKIAAERVGDGIM